MPWTHKYNARADTFITRASGVITDEVAIVGVRNRLCDPNVHEGVRHFYDFADVDRYETTDHAVEALLPDEARQPKQGRRAYLMFNPAGAAEYERHMRRLLTENVRVFYSRQEAVDWLNEGMPADKMLTIEDTLPEEKRQYWKS